jgi:hypothetical protein
VNPLEHVPVLDELSLVIEPKNIDAGPIAISGPVLKTMQDNVVIRSPEQLSDDDWRKTNPRAVSLRGEIERLMRGLPVVQPSCRRSILPRLRFL